MIHGLVKQPLVFTMDELIDYIRCAMPMDKPLLLTVNEVYALSAYMFNLNGLVPADAMMDQNTLSILC